MLAEWNKPGIPDGRFTKRWFGDQYFDLFVWLDTRGSIVSFQLCYEKPLEERALTWRSPSTYYHQRVDDGEGRPGRSKSTPILLPDGKVNIRPLADRFMEECEEIEGSIAWFVYQKILDYGTAHSPVC